MNIIETYHKDLIKYKGKHTGEKCYIFGSGPSFRKFKKPEDGIFIGCNHIIKDDYIRENIDYYFFGHGYLEHKSNSGTYGNHQKEVNDLGDHIPKFCMVSRDNDFSVHKFTKKEILKLKDINALPCDINLENIHLDLSKNSFLNHSIVFPATQFALYCGFLKIYIVGCDCTGSAYFWDGSKKVKHDPILVSWWKKMYEFKSENYPDTKLININPVGLKGLMDEDINT